MLQTLNAWARKIKRQLLVLYLAAQDPQTPWYAKVWMSLVLAYAFSPIDLIPDFIPVLGLLDDAVLLPLGILLALKLVPPAVLSAAQQRADTLGQGSRPTSVAGAVFIVLLWVVAAGLGARFVWLRLHGVQP